MNAPRVGRHLALPGVVMLAACADTNVPSGPETAISVTITAGRDTVVHGDTVTLTARASRVGSGDTVPDVTVTWFTPAGVPLAEGNSVLFRPADTGAVRIVALVRTPSGTLASGDVTIHAVPNAPPAVTDFAVWGAYYAGQSVLLQARADDSEGVESVSWFSNRLGRIGTGDSVEWRLPPDATGPHLITASVRDGAGAARDTSIRIEVLPGERIRWTRPYRGGGDRALLALRDDGVIVTSLSLADSTCYHCLLAISPDGNELWRQSVDQISPNNHSGGLTVAANGTSFIFGWRGRILAVSAAGDRLWERQLLGFDPHGRMALSPDGALYAAGQHAENTSIGTGAGAVFERIDPATGAVVWEIRRPGRFFWMGASVTVDGTMVAALDGLPMWVTPDGTILREGPEGVSASFSRGALGADSALYIPQGRSLEKIGPDGIQRWVTSVDQGLGEPVIDGLGSVYVSGEDRSPLPLDDRRMHIYRLDAATGAVIWQVPIGGLAFPWVGLTADGGLLANAADRLVNLDAASGTERWSVPVPGGLGTSFAVADDGSIYFVSRGGVVISVRGDASLMHNAPWPAWRADNRRTASVTR